MREILFRGKLKHDINPQKHAGDWVYGALLDHWKDKDGVCILEKNACIGLYVEPKTVGQFTGLLDKNGTRIFEGDIVGDIAEVFFSCRGKARGVITWYEPVCAFTLKIDTFHIYLLNEVSDHPESVKVLGNIHDNEEEKNEHFQRQGIC